jgi:hypothetical protein
VTNRIGAVWSAIALTRTALITRKESSVATAKLNSHQRLGTTVTAVALASFAPKLIYVAWKIIT